MVYVGISKLSLTDLIFVYVWNQWRLLPWHAPVTAAVARDVWRVRRFLHLSTRQRTCTPGKRHCAISWTGNSRFHSSWTVAPNSTDLNPVDYKIWDDIQQRVHQSQLHSIDELKKSLLTFGTAWTRASYGWFTPPTRRRARDKTVLSCPRQRCEQANYWRYNWRVA